MIEARAYQEATYPALHRFWREQPKQFPLVVMATGAGKTISMALVLQKLFTQYENMDALVLAHRRELIAQTEQKIRMVFPNAPMGVYSAALKRREISPITIASRDTLAPALPKLPDFKPRLILLDEAHNLSPKEETRYQKMFATLIERNSTAMFVGFTATPFRAGTGVIYGPGEFFGGIAHEVKMRTLLNEGYLMPLVPGEVDQVAKPNTSKVPIVNGEFNQKKLRAVTEHHHLVEGAVSEWIRLARNTGRKHTMFYAVSVEHAKQVQKELETYHVSSHLVTGDTSNKERTIVNELFLAREIEAVINVGVYTEGTDFPCIDCLVNLRAIQSLNLYLQIMGRGMRPDPLNPFGNCLVLDFGDCVHRFGPVDTAQPAEKRIGKPNKRTKVCPECKTINSYYAFKCCKPECDFQFDEMPHQTCKECGETCAPQLRKCPACGHLFVKHMNHSCRADFISNGHRFGRYSVTGIRAYKKKSVAGGFYLELCYDTPDISQTYRDRLMIGYDGRTGENAVVRWKQINRPGIEVPRTVDEAMAIIMHHRNEQWLPVHEIMVDHNDSFNRIVLIIYRDDIESAT